MNNQSELNYLERADYTWSSDSIRFINTPTLSARQTYFYVQEAGYFKTAPPLFYRTGKFEQFSDYLHLNRKRSALMDLLLWGTLKNI